jgi:YbbR domain-containing protein
MKSQTLRSLINQIFSLGMALLFALIIWSFATNEQNPSREAFFPDALQIEIANRAEGLLVYQKTVETVRVKVRAPQASWDQLRPASFRVAADLKSRDTGLHQIPITVQVTDPRVVVVDVEPAEVGIRLERLKSREFKIHGDVLDAAPLGYTFQPPVMNPITATVSGPAILVDQVTEVVADIFLRGAKTLIERDTAILARDSQGKVVLGVTIAPAAVLVKVQVEQRVGYKDVSIKTVLKGNVAPGYWISNIVVTPTAATIVGNADALAKIPGFVETLPIEVEGATTDVTKRAVLGLPDGVSVLNTEGVTVQVSVTPILGGQTVRRPVSLQGLRAGLKATIAPDSVEVILSGPVIALQNLTPNDVQVILDVAGLAPGTHAIKPRVPSLPPNLRAQSIVPDSVQVVIVEPATPTITATVMLTPTLTLTPTRTLTPTLTPKPEPVPTR